MNAGMGFYPRLPANFENAGILHTRFSQKKVALFRANLIWKLFD